MPDVLGDRTARVVAGRNVWNELIPLLAPYSASITAAVAYVGSGASDLLKLRRGSSIIVDADPRTVRAGSTDPRVLLDWAKAGVKVYSLKNLHAKLILAEAVDAEHDAYAVIGSANLSQSSANRLYESVVLADGECLDEVRDALIEWKSRATLLRAAELEDLVGDFGADRTPSPDGDGEGDDDDDEVDGRKRWSRPTLLHLATVDSDSEPTEEAKAMAEKLSGEYGLDENPDYRIDMFWWDDAEGIRYGDGDHVILVEGTKSGRPRRNGEVGEPGKLVHTYLDSFVSPPRRYYYLLVQRSDYTVTVPDVEAAFEELGEKPDFRDGKYVRKAFVGALLDLWPDLEYDQG
ncbi:phospholipase D family protein [Prescottella agglutinans]|uniref:phospholipase D family protein n=1 Tax=Prescottella agglutinans TaxID=1644129 RepID=UPI003D996EA5